MAANATDRPRDFGDRARDPAGNESIVTVPWTSQFAQRSRWEHVLFIARRGRVSCDAFTPRYFTPLRTAAGRGSVKMSTYLAGDRGSSRRRSTLDETGPRGFPDDPARPPYGTRGTADPKRRAAGPTFPGGSRQTRRDYADNAYWPPGRVAGTRPSPPISARDAISARGMRAGAK